MAVIHGRTESEVVTVYGGDPIPFADALVTDEDFGTWFYLQTVTTLDATCLAMLEQQTGLVFDPSWLSMPLPTYRIPDPDALLKDVENARLP